MARIIMKYITWAPDTWLVEPSHFELICVRLCILMDSDKKKFEPLSSYFFKEEPISLKLKIRVGTRVHGFLWFREPEKHSGSLHRIRLRSPVC